jgi:hypothetical protein
MADTGTFLLIRAKYWFYARHEKGKNDYFGIYFFAAAM